MVHFAEIYQAPPPYSMLQYIGRKATPKLVPRYRLRYLQTTLIMGKGDWSQNLCEILSKKIDEKQKKAWKNLAFFYFTLTVLDVWDITNGFMTNWATP